MTSWFGNQWGKFLSSMPENIGVFAVIFFLLFIAVRYIKRRRTQLYPDGREHERKCLPRRQNRFRKGMA